MKKTLFQSMVFCLTLLTFAAFTGCEDNAAASSDAERHESAISSIVGTWREDKEYGINILSIKEDGSYTVYHTSGDVEQGTIKTERDESDDGVSAAKFRFYDEFGELWSEFPNLPEYAENPPVELISESSDRMHFIRMDESQKAAAEDYPGTWQSGRCSITVSKTKNGYKVNITWGSSAFENSEWNYICRYDEKSAELICDGGATLVNHKYDENGKDIKTTVYKDGSGSFKVTDGLLRWTDNKENAGKDLYFAPLPDNE